MSSLGARRLPKTATQAGRTGKLYSRKAALSYPYRLPSPLLHPAVAPKMAKAIFPLEFYVCHAEMAKLKRSCILFLTPEDKQGKKPVPLVDML